MKATLTDSISAAAPVMEMQAEVIVLAGPPGVEQLTYSVPPELAGTLLCGHRVIVPLRSRKVTGVVIKLGGDRGQGAALKPIVEILEPQPILDSAHLQLIEFLASYYMTTLGEAYRAVIPGAFRIETRRLFRLVRRPDLLALAAFGPAEKAVAGALAARPHTMRQLARIAEGPALRSALGVLDSHGLLERTEGARGRHREAIPMLARLRENSGAAKVRGHRQRAIIEMISGAAGVATSVAQIEATIPNARAVLRALQSRGIMELIAAPPRTVSLDSAAVAGLELNEEQAAAIRAIGPAIERGAFEPFLLWGVTASGKTEIYLQLAAQCIAADRRVLLLVPEIALADQLVGSFRARFGELVAIAHSGQRVAERWASWRAALGGQARVMIGPRSAIFAPISGLGLIVVDEEHDPSYKQDDGIRYNARDLAVALARFSRCPVVLGSATPSAESFANTRSGRYRMIQLPRRIADRALAAVEVVDLRAEFRPTQANASARSAKTPDAPPPVPLSAALQAALRENLAAGGQSMIFINRRGYHSFLQCHLCGSVISCRNCSVSMTFHMRDRSIRCHYCGERSSAPDVCPECRGLGLEGQGFGTERLVASLQTLLPSARIERMDSDISGRGGARNAILQALARGEIDVLVGTQMITKGFDFPGVTLVAAVQADLALNMPDFRSAERTFQLLTQVAGRAGRGERPGRVIIQTWAPNHYSIRAARDQDYARFIRRELELRRELGYPPYMRLAMVRIEGGDARKVEAIAGDVAASLARAADLASMRVLGPAPAPIERIRNRFRWQVIVKARALPAMRTALAAMRTAVAARAQAGAVHVMIDIDPVNMM